MSNKIIIGAVFLGSFCTMVLELVAGRIMAPYLGVSLYTWTSVIGVILGGISLGNFWGGRLADSQPNVKRIFSGAFFLSGLTSVLILYVAPIVGLSLQTSLIPLPLATLLFSLVAFFPPSVFLGSISPMAVKMILKNLEKSAGTVGQIYACSTLGSIIGTFVTGYWLIAWFGTKATVFGVSIVLVAIGLYFSKELLKDVGRTTKLFFVLIFVMPLAAPGVCQVDTQYFCLSSAPTHHPQLGDGVIFKLDHLIHSYLFPGEEAKLGYDYEQVYANLAEYRSQEQPMFSSLSVGGGGYAFPRYLERFYKSSHVEVVEIDPGVTRFVFDRLDLNPETKIITYNQDARIFLERLPLDKKYDLIWGDAFNDFSVPYHLTTVEYIQELKNHLTSDGFYAANVIDNLERGTFLKSYYQTIKQVFPHVYLVLEDAASWDQRNTYVIIAGNQPLDLERWYDIDLNAVIGDKISKEITYFLPKYLHILSDQEVKKAILDKNPIVLTDDYVPVDNMLAKTVFAAGHGLSR